MAIVGIIVLIAGQAFSDSTKFRVRTQNMLKATQEAENIASIFKSDVIQMGAKSAQEDGTSEKGDEYGDKFSAIYDSVYMDPYNPVLENVDLSSFLISSSSNFIFRRVRYDADGAYKAVEEVHWFVENEGKNSVYKVLKRACRTVDGVADDDGICPADKTRDEAAAEAVEIARGVVEFRVFAPEPIAASEEQIFPTSGNTFRLIPRTEEEHYFNFSSVGSDGNPNSTGEEIVLTQFYTNYDNAHGKLKTEHSNMNQAFAVNPEDPDAGDWKWKDYCENRGLIPLEKNNTYEISFEVPFTSISNEFEIQPFVPGEDHMSVGFRGKISGEVPTIKKDDKRIPIVEDFLFFPPYSSKGSGKRYMRFTVPADVDTVCLAFTFACYSPKASQATLKISNLKIKKIPGLNYSFDKANPGAYDPEDHKNDKKNIKALMLRLRLGRGGSGKVNAATGKIENGETGEIEMVIPTPSNGPND